MMNELKAQGRSGRDGPTLRRGVRTGGLVIFRCDDGEQPQLATGDAVRPADMHILLLLTA